MSKIFFALSLGLIFCFFGIDASRMIESSKKQETVYIKGHKFTFQKGFWCAIAAGEVTRDISVMILKDEHQKKMIAFPKIKFEITEIPSSGDVKEFLISKPEVYSDDTKIEIDQLECEEANLQQLQNLPYK